MRIAFLIDHYDKLNFASDSTLQLMKEAKSLNYDIWFFTPTELFFDNKVKAILHKIKIVDFDNKKLECEAGATQDLENMDIILIRQDPPYDMAYLTCTYLLEMVNSKTLILNNPASIRNNPEKISVLNFKSLFPPTLISRDYKQIEAFIETHEETVIKPLYSHAGKDVFFLKKGEKNLKVIIENFDKQYKEQWIIQKYLKEIETGDKRIILIDGEISGYFRRVPETTQIRSNLAVGGSAASCELTKRDIEICRNISNYLKLNNLFFVGIDIIGDYLIEINVTSPTGIVSINKVCNIAIEKIFWEKVKEKLNHH